MSRANLEGASLIKCNFEDPTGHKANLEGACMTMLYCQLFLVIMLRLAFICCTSSTTVAVNLCRRSLQTICNYRRLPVQNEYLCFFTDLGQSAVNFKTFDLIAASATVCYRCRLSVSKNQGFSAGFALGSLRRSAVIADDIHQYKPGCTAAVK